ncbi:unnamed protein product [Clonostachys rosea]|uniref:NmrA-like domain-containing protein n=1 Tax=Bionectria ochroleuca TaxID=29856 RepID=A0ABY6UU84_BIOOC|nr:unnamed protein product [Clonostachys rosea]
MKVIIVGATGETGQSIVNGLLGAPAEFDITAITRKSSINNSKNQKLRDDGVKVVGVDLDGPQEDLVNVISGADTLISCLNPQAFQSQVPLADAAKKAGVKRFVPCFFATVAPPKGVMSLREQKEDILNYIKKIYLPYTVIDVGWWYQLTPPRLPSGRIDSSLVAPCQGLYGDGTTLSALTDSRDIGRYVARIIDDPRTLNNMVFAYSETLTQIQVYQTLERLSQEKLEYNYITKEALENRISLARDALNRASAEDYRARAALWNAEYGYSWGVRGDNAPERARFLGYLDVKDLYPDAEWISFETYISELLDGTARRAYS